MLYHFPSKEALIGRLIERFEAAPGRELKKDRGAGGGRWSRAYGRLSFAEDRWYLHIGAGLLAAVTEAPALLEIPCGGKLKTGSDGPGATG